MIIIIRTLATPEQMEEMFDVYKFYIKVAVDIERRILAGGGQLHSDCESELLDDGSYQENLWGAGFMPSTGKITYDSIINLRPRQNRSMEIMDATIREQVAEVIKQLLGDV